MIAKFCTVYINNIQKLEIKSTLATSELRHRNIIKYSMKNRYSEKNINLEDKSIRL